MTVRELRELLEKLTDQDAEVRIQYADAGGDYDGNGEVWSVGILSSGKVLISPK